MSAQDAPAAAQRLLLRAACGQGDGAREAWKSWRATADIEHLDSASTLLLPQLYRNLLTLGVDDPALELLKGVYRHTWSTNARMLHATGRVLGRLAAAGVPTLVFDGVALLAVYYRDHGARRLDSSALLVARNDVAAASRVLLECGWTPTDPVALAGPAGHRGSSRFGAPGGPVDLHWDLLREGTPPQVQSQFWADAPPADILGSAIPVLAPADQLLQVCVRAARPDEPAQWRRLADAMVLLRAAGERLVWDRLVEHTRSARVVVPVLASLRLLVEVLEAPVPPSVIEALEHTQPSRMERLEERWYRSPTPRLGTLPAHLFRYWRVGGDPGGGAMTGFARYLQHAWGVERTWQLPMAIMRKSVRKAFSRG